ncbi:MAG: hypothetical protein B6U97_03640 [Candidatus Altiarchaeales archaeon ex4484_96]|nr:MAG: hypothetical protein B6U97_03640 [Candidatus Altiarchaeales archaeon ex4484_96]
MEKKLIDELREKYGSYLMGDEKPFKSFKIGDNQVVLTNERLICLKSFPKSFTPVFYDDILNIEHHTFISWDKLVRGVVLLIASVIAFYNPSLMDLVFDFLRQNIPELNSLLSLSNPMQVMLLLVFLLVIVGLHQIIQFIFTLTGKLRISIKGVSSLRIRTKFTPEVGDLIKTLEAIRKDGVKEFFSESVSGDKELEIKPGQTCIIKEYRPDKSTELFFNEVSNPELTGLYISRLNPKKVSAHPDLINVSYYWLTDSLTDMDSVSPEPERIFALITSFLEKSPNAQSIILFDGIEYLITHSNFEQALHLIQGLVDKIGVHSSRLIIPLNPDALSSKEMALLEREVSTVL